MTKAEAVIRALRGEATGCIGCNRADVQIFHTTTSLDRCVAIVCSVCVVKIKRALRFTTVTEAVNHALRANGIISASEFSSMRTTSEKALQEIREICGWHDERAAGIAQPGLEVDSVSEAVIS